MANRRFTLTKQSTEILDRIMVELDLQDNRPEALKIALAKGLSESLQEPPEITDKSSGFTVGDGVIAKDEDYTLYKHLIIERVGKPIDDKDIDKFIQRLIEHGLSIMGKELDQLSDLDNYLLYLVEKPTK